MSLSPSLASVLDRFVSWNSVSPIVVSTTQIEKIIYELFQMSLSFEDLSELAHPDVAYFAPREDAYKVEEIREVITRATIMPSGKFQVIVISQVDNMSKESANALLKTFEDIPFRTLFLLTLESRESLLETITSRVQFLETTDIAREISEATKVLADGLMNASTPAIAQYYATKSFSRIEALELLFALEGAAERRASTLPIDFFEILSECITCISATNAITKYQLDRVVLCLLKVQSIR